MGKHVLHCLLLVRFVILSHDSVDQSIDATLFTPFNVKPANMPYKGSSSTLSTRPRRFLCSNSVNNCPLFLNDRSQAIITIPGSNFCHSTREASVKCKLVAVDLATIRNIATLGYYLGRLINITIINSTSTVAR
jgi:hypothetical protein